MTGVHCPWDGVDDQDVVGGRTLPVIPNTLVLGSLENTRRKAWCWSTGPFFTCTKGCKSCFLVSAWGRTVSSNPISQRYPMCHVQNLMCDSVGPFNEGDDKYSRVSATVDRGLTGLCATYTPDNLDRQWEAVSEVRGRPPSQRAPLCSCPHRDASNNGYKGICCWYCSC